MNYGRTSLRRRAKQLDARGTRIRHKIGVILGKLLLIGIIVGGCAAVSFGVGGKADGSSVRTAAQNDTPEFERRSGCG